jgi:hypothetical protein
MPPTSPEHGDDGPPTNVAHYSAKDEAEMRAAMGGDEKAMGRLIKENSARHMLTRNLYAAALAHFVAAHPEAAEEASIIVPSPAAAALVDRAGAPVTVSSRVLCDGLQNATELNGRGLLFTNFIRALYSSVLLDSSIA